MTTKHPYYPVNATIADFQENDMGMLKILVLFFGVLAAALPLLAGVSMRGYKSSGIRKLALCWFLLSGCIHTILEGHFSVYHADIASRMDFLSQVWKEYARGDSRYVIQDTFTICMETVTSSVEGPLCFLTVWSFVNHHSSRYLLQLVVSLAQFYGCVLYFFTEWMDGFSHGPLYHPLYFWFYFVFMNLLWIVIPFALMVDSWVNLNSAQYQVDERIKRRK